MKNLYVEGFKVPRQIQKLRDAWFESDTKRDSGLSEPADIFAWRDISYGQYGNYNLLDVYKPENRHMEKMPVIVNIHGGGYFYGSKEIYKYYCMNLAQDGFAVVNFNYRLSPEFHFPAALEDINRVMHFVEANAIQYGLDVENVFLIGDSAGAQLVSHYAAIFTNNDYAALYSLTLPEKIKIKGLSMACGMYNLKERISQKDRKSLFRFYLGKDKMNEAASMSETFDVLGHITKDFPPAYVFSSKDDSLREACMPMYDFLIGRGCRAEADIYGLDCDFPSYHIFHVDLNHPLSNMANRKQADFMRGYIS